MKKIFAFAVFAVAGGALLAAPKPSAKFKDIKRDPAVVKSYIRSVVGDDTLKEIQGREGGKKFLSQFFSDVDWMEQFAGSGPWSNEPWQGLKTNTQNAGKALKALDLLVWNDEDEFITGSGSKIGRYAATALALNHGWNWDDEKLVRVMECYREWAKDGTLNTDAWNHDVRKWREIMGFGQNAELSVENLRWIHDFANVDADRYYAVCWNLAYRLWNCFGASVHTADYYRPWAHRWNTQELRYRVGGVCGAISKFGSHSAASHGVRAYTAGQPGHCAYILWDYNMDAWGLGNAVTAHTDPHNTLGGQGFAALQEQDRYFEDKRRMTAEYLRWKGDFKDSMRMCPGNWCAAVAWYCELEKRNAPQAEWDDWAATVRETFSEAPAQGWQLYLPYLNRMKGRDAKLAAAKLALAAMRENKAKTVEAPYWDEIALTPLDKMFKDDDKAAWEIFETALEKQAGTPTFFRQTLAWGSNRLMTDGESAKRFLVMAGKIAQKYKVALDYKGMILKAAKDGDIVMFQQVYKLMDKLNPEMRPKGNGKGWPQEANGGQLLSKDGMLQTSGTSNWEDPVTYRNALDASDFAAGNAFHTDGGETPWGMVILPGASEIKAVTVVNVPGQNAGRQVPLCIWVSDNGTDFKEIWRTNEVKNEWRYELPSPVMAKYIKVGRPAGTDNKQVFHLRKILVYGRKLY